MEAVVDVKHSTKSLGFRAVVLTQFLTTFNDNAFRMTIILLAFWRSPKSGDAIASAATILFLLPYALLSLLAGVLSDRYSKRSVFVVWKFLEIPMVLIGTIGLAFAGPEHGNWPMLMLLIMLTGLGVQTAFLAPARYGILPEILEDRELAHGNGDLELGSYFGILAGTISAGLIVKGVRDPTGYWWTLTIMPAVALLGAACSLLVPKVRAANRQEPIIEGILPRKFFHNWRRLAEHKGLVPTVYGLTLFWGISTLYLLNTVSFGVDYLGYTQNPESNAPLLAAISVGIGLGSWMAGRISIGSIELGLLPIGVATWCVASLCLLTADSAATTCFWLVFAGAGAGLFVVPLNAYLEKYSPPEERASCIATSNIVTVVGMIVACLVIWAAPALGISPKGVFLLAGVLLLAATLIIFRAVPDYFCRLAITLLMRSLYRVRVFGIENVPTEGPALLVFNHVSYADGNLVISCIKRFIRFVVWQGHYEGSRLLRAVGETMQAIPIDRDGSPKDLVRSLRRASDALNRGELVCIYPEGAITRTGSLRPFHRGLEVILKRAPHAVVIPGYIDGMWGSIFSYQGGSFFRKWPKRIRYPVRIKFGAPMPSNSTVAELRQCVQELGADCYELRKSEQLPLHRRFLRVARWSPRRPCMTDRNTPMISYGRALVGSVAMGSRLRRKLGPEQYVGLFVPPSVGGALANVAVSYLGKIPVNLNYTVGADVLDKCIAQCGIKHVITSRKFLDKVELRPNAELILLEDLRGELSTGDKLRGLAARLLPAWITERLILGLGRDSMDDLATVIFSSGSTGTPKGVMLTHQNIVSNIDSVVEMVDATKNDVLTGVLPFFHSFGFTGTLWLPLMIRASVGYHFNPLEAEAIGGLIRETRATIFLSTATFLRSYMRKFDKDDLKSLRLIICGAEKLPMQVAEQFEKKYGIRPMEGYGCTELSPAVSTNRPDFVHGEYRQIAHKPGAIGHPMPGQAVRIVDPESHEPLALGSEGLLLVKGPNVMKGYLDNPELTAEVVRDGWYATGDIAKLDEDGFITITDRISRFSKIGGEMVPHGMVEDMVHEILDTHERLCAVVGLPDPRKGERLIVIHKPLPIEPGELWNRMKERGIPALWLPARTAFHEVDDLPILGTGKLDLKGIKDLAHEKAGI